MTSNGSATEQSASTDSFSGGDRRGRIEHTINNLINERQQVLVFYGKLAGLKSFEETEEIDSDNVDASSLREFLQLLMDYTALGHFEIYQRIIEGKERRISVQQASEKVYGGIAETTDYLIDFNDKYDRYAGTEEEQKTIEADLSKLGEILAVRGEFEDEILNALKKGKNS